MSKISDHQQQYLKKLKRDRILIHVCRLLLFFTFLAFWEIGARAGWFDSFIFSSPSKVFHTFLSMCREEALIFHIGITLLETLISFFLVAAITIAFAVLLWMFPGLSKLLDPYFVVLNSLPKSALAPLLIVWFGANMKTIIIAGISVAIFGSILNLYTGFSETDPEKLKLILTLGGTKKDQLSKIVLPSSVPLILSIMKVNIGLCLVGVVIGEFIGARQGLGYLIIYGSQVFKLDWVIMSITLLCLIAMSLYSIISVIQKAQRA